MATDPRIDGFQSGLASIIWKFFNERSKKVLGSGIENKQLANELHKPIFKKFKKRKIYSSYLDNIWGVDLEDTQVISKFNEGIIYLLCVIDFFSRYAWVVGLRGKKGSSIANGF